MNARRSARTAAGGLLLLAALACSVRNVEAQLAGSIHVGPSFGDGYGTMIGGSIGIEFPLIFGEPAYVGPWVMYNAGGEFVREDELFDQKSTFVGVEGGGMFLQKPFMIRGAGNIAAAFITTDRESVVGTISETALDLSGGVAFGYQWGKFYAAVEPYTFLIIGSDNMGGNFSLFLTLGYRPRYKPKEE